MFQANYIWKYILLLFVGVKTEFFLCLGSKKNTIKGNSIG